MEFIMTQERKQLLEDLFITVWEDVDYWFDITEDDRKTIRQERENRYPDLAFSEVLFKMMMENKKKIQIIDRETEEVLGTISGKELSKSLSTMKDKYNYHYNNIIDGNHDAEDADVWFQVAVMNEVVFG